MGWEKGGMGVSEVGFWNGGGREEGNKGEGWGWEMGWEGMKIGGRVGGIYLSRRSRCRFWWSPL